MAAITTIEVNSSLRRNLKFSTIHDLKNYFLSIKDQLPTSVKDFNFIARSPVFEIHTFVTVTTVCQKLYVLYKDATYKKMPTNKPLRHPLEL